MKHRLGQHGLARKKRLGNLFGNAHCPPVMTGARVGQRNQIIGIRDTVHFFENPLRVDSSKLDVYIFAIWVRQLLFVRQKSWQAGLSRRLRKWASRKGSSFARIWSRLGKA